MDEILDSQRTLYNAALQSRIDYYRKTGKSLTLFQQIKQLTECRKCIQEMAELPANLQRSTLVRLDRAYKGFFRRLRTKSKAGFPRFKSSDRFKSFGFNEYSGVRLVGNRLHFKGIPGSLRIMQHREMPDGKICTCSLKKDANGWAVSFQVKFSIDIDDEAKPDVGIDCGITDLAILSTGKRIPNERITKRYEKELRRRQRHLSRCKRGSSGRNKARLAVARVHLKIANTRNTYLHQASRSIVNDHGTIVVENLNVKGLSAGILAKSIHDAAWGKFLGFIAYKAEGAGCDFIEVSPKNTSQECSSCGSIVKKKLHERTHECPECGLVLDRDHNAALNILHRGVVVPGRGNVTQWGERSGRNISLELPK